MRLVICLALIKYKLRSNLSLLMIKYFHRIGIEFYFIGLYTLAVNLINKGNYDVKI